MPENQTNPSQPASSAAPQPQAPEAAPQQQVPAQPASPYQQQVPPSGAQQSPYQQPAGGVPPYGQQYAEPMDPATANAPFPRTKRDSNLMLANFVLCVISCVASCWLIFPLAWMIPMTVISWGLYKGKKRNTVAFDVCTLIFVSLIGGILLLIADKNEQYQ